jgi:hypothetical protein
MNLLKDKIFISVFLLVASFAFYGRANAAVLHMKPPQAEVTVGNIVNVQVTVDTLGKVINNAESVIQFSADLLEVVSIDNKSSIFSLWVENPSFSNGAGQVTFNGGVPNPGFSGSNGNILSITFRTKKVGTASVFFSNSAVRENDGLGTDILSDKIGSTITIVSSLDTTPVQKSSAFIITSSSHQNQNSWYSKNDVDITWTLPKNTTAVKTLLGAYPNSEPTVYYGSPITNKNIEDVEDGTWYFHIKYLAGGVWSKTEHYRLQIDTASPTDLRVEDRKDDAGKVILDMKAGDSLSGIDHFTVAVNSDKPIVVKSDANGEASLEVPFSRSGEHPLTVSAFDKAGNKAETKIDIIADNIPGLRIDSYPATIKLNESIEISGTAPYPYASLRVSLKDNDNVVQTYKIKSNSYSKFNFISQPVGVEGNYTLWVDMLRDNEEISLSSQQVTVSVETPLLLQMGSYTIGLMKVLIPAVTLLIIFLLIVLYGWYKFFALYRKVKKESREAEKVLSKSFDILRKDLKDHIVRLRKVESSRKLTAEETKFLEQFEEELSDAEDAITKEVQDISNDGK